MVRVLPRVDVDRAPERVRAQVSRAPDDTATVEGRGVSCPHRLEVIGPVQLLAPPEAVDPVHASDRILSAVDGAKRTYGLASDRLVDHDLAAVSIAVVAPVVHADEPEPFASDRATAMPAASDHRPPDLRGEAHDSRVEPVQLGALLCWQFDAWARSLPG